MRQYALKDIPDDIVRDILAETLSELKNVVKQNNYLIRENTRIVNQTLNARIQYVHTFDYVSHTFIILVSIWFLFMLKVFSDIENNVFT